MFHHTVIPRFQETDALGHVNNSVLAVWFEESRVGIFEIFNPELSLKKWNLILRRAEYDYLGQIHLGSPVEIETALSKIGTTSVSAVHRALQNGVEVARGTSVMVHFDYRNQQKQPIPEPVRKRLSEHLIDSSR